MHMDITVRHFEHSGLLRRFARQRLEAALERFAQHVASVRLRLVNDAARQSSDDKRCQVHVHLQGGGDMLVERRHDHAGGAVAECLGSLQTALSRQLRRRRRDKRRDRRAA